MLQFPRTFWVANTIELFERWAWYGFFMLFANYLTEGLGFDQSQKGWLMGVGTGILYFLPVITGAISDRYGYKRVLTVAFVVYVSAFLLMPQVTSYASVFLVYIYLALGAALFKPIISATIAKTTNESNSSIGFGIFYMMVNIGAFIGPMVTLIFKENYANVFYISSAIISLNFIMLLFYKEPNREEKKEYEPLSKTIADIFSKMMSIFHDPKFLVFLLIVAGFWTMYNQLFFTLPVFITQWVDTSSVYAFFAEYAPFFSNNYSPAPGVMDAEFITNFDALYIIVFQIAVSSIVMKLKPLRAMMSGFLVCSIGMALTLFTQNVLFTLVAILIFSLGEMAGSPKITEYIGQIADADKKALYMGYSFIPVFIGNVLAGIISGNVYQAMSDKVELARRFAATHGVQIDAAPNSSDFFQQLAASQGLSDSEMTNLLWDTYNPSSIWLVILSIGLISTLALLIYDRVVNKATKA